MKPKISILIPTYNSPDSLDLLVKSCVEGCDDQNNVEIIIGVDGTHEVNKHVLNKWQNYVKTLILDENQGLCRLTNLLVYSASSDAILIVNDDNILPKHYDTRLLKCNIENSVIAPNQIEPFPSMFKQFHIKDLGRSPKTFDLDKYWSYAESISESKIDSTGSTLPIYMLKANYLKVGGWDSDYPGHWVCDWEFFMKCQMSGMKMERIYDVNVYHFVSLSTKTPDVIEKNLIKERECHEFAKFKWGQYIKHSPESNLKYI